MVVKICDYVQNFSGVSFELLEHPIKFITSLDRRVSQPKPKVVPNRTGIFFMKLAGLFPKIVWLLWAAAVFSPLISDESECLMSAHHASRNGNDSGVQLRARVACRKQQVNCLRCAYDSVKVTSGTV